VQKGDALSAYDGAAEHDSEMHSCEAGMSESPEAAGEGGLQICKATEALTSHTVPFSGFACRRSRKHAYT
jgi:hypothetical protein